MTHRNDSKLSALETLTGNTGNIDDLEMEWLLTVSGSTVTDPNSQWLATFLANGATSTNFNTAASEFLIGLGYTGALPDMWDAYWVAGGGVGAADSLLTDLIAWWPLDEASGVRFDSHTNFRNLQDNNTVLSVTGKVSDAADFVEANSEYLSIADNTDLSMGDVDMAMAFWVKIDDLGTHFILGKAVSTSAADREYFFQHASTGDLFGFGVGDGSVNTTVEATTFGASTTGTWFFIYAYHDATANEIGISVNDGTIDTASHTTGIQDNTSEFTVGRAFSAFYTDTSLDELAIWKGRVLTSAEVTRLYNSGSGMAYPGGDNGSPDTSTLKTNLIAWWDLDETSGTRADSHGSNTLTDNNTVLSVAGKISNGADFVEANSEYLSIADNTDLSMGDVDMAIACWVKIDDLGTHRILGKADTVNPAGMEYALQHATAGDLFGFVTSDGTTTTILEATTYGASTVDEWVFIYAYHDATANEIGISINGGTIDTAALSVGIQDSDAPFEIGRHYGGSAGYLDGSVDECAIWKGRILTAAEVQVLYNSGAGIAYPT